MEKLKRKAEENMFKSKSGAKGEKYIFILILYYVHFNHLNKVIHRDFTVIILLEFFFADRDTVIDSTHHVVCKADSSSR